MPSMAEAPASPCPVLLWFEHTPNEAEDDLPAAIEAAGLGGLQDAHLSAVRSVTGFVVQATRDGGSETEIAAGAKSEQIESGSSPF